MNKCEKCYHKKVCINGANYKNAGECNHYKDENLIVELPCKVGEKLYVVDYVYGDNAMPHYELTEKTALEASVGVETEDCRYDENDFGYCAFITKEAAIRYLEEQISKED